VLEYCAESELHPRSGLGMPEGAADLLPQLRTSTHKKTVHNESSSAPSGRPRFGDIPGVKTPGLVLLSLRDKSDGRCYPRYGVSPVQTWFCTGEFYDRFMTGLSNRFC
jgi:hypothetical protein